MEVGTSKPFYEMKYDDWDHIVTPTWITHLWKYWRDAEVQPELSDMWTYVSNRKNDAHIMDLLLPNIPNKTVHHKLNTCRIDLQLITVSDMVDVLGRRVLPNIIDGSNHRKSRLYWPSTDTPKNTGKSGKHI